MSTIKQPRGIDDGRLTTVDVQGRSIGNRKSTIENSAARYLVGGVNSPVRAFRHVGGDPLLLVGGRGATVTDTDGHEFVDFIMGWGCLILGHRPAPVVRALQQGIRRGVLTGLTHPLEIELARLICEAAPSVEQVRFTASGTEACMTAVKIARAHTGRSKILMFDGCYHGHSDSVMALRSAGIPGLTVQETLSVPFNDPTALEEAVRAHARELACVIIEPVAANMGVVIPESGYLAMLRELTSRHGVLLIFDEVVTGFRVGYGGAQGLFGMRPDLTTFGKIIGGGLPVGAVGGARQLMQRLAPEGDVYHGGTFAGHPLTMASGAATLQALRAHPPYERIDALAERLEAGLLDGARAAEVPVVVNRLGSMLTLFFTERPVRSLADAKASQRERFARWAQVLRRQGILIPPSPFEALFVSAAHRAADVERFAAASHAAMALIAEGAH